MDFCMLFSGCRSNKLGLDLRYMNRGLIKVWFSKRVVLADVPPERKPERGYIRMFPRNENRTEGTCAWDPQNENWNEGTFTKTTLCETALLSPGEWRGLPSQQWSLKSFWPVWRRGFPWICQGFSSWGAQSWMPARICAVMVARLWVTWLVCSIEHVVPLISLTRFQCKSLQLPPHLMEHQNHSQKQLIIMWEEHHMTLRHWGIHMVAIQCSPAYQLQFSVKLRTPKFRMGEESLAH